MSDDKKVKREPKFVINYTFQGDFVVGRKMTIGTYNENVTINLSIPGNGAESHKADGKKDDEKGDKE